jgi:hypothetical protein
MNAAFPEQKAMRKCEIQNTRIARTWTASSASWFDQGQAPLNCGGLPYAVIAVRARSMNWEAMNGKFPQ